MEEKEPYTGHGSVCGMETREVSRENKYAGGSSRKMHGGEAECGRRRAREYKMVT